MTAFVPLPSAGVRLVEFVPDSATFATSVVSWANTTFRQSNLGQALSLDWTQKVTPLQADEQQPAKAVRRKAYHLTCSEAGICLCCESAAPMVKFRLVLIKSLTNNFTARGKPKSALVSGRVILELHWETSEPPQTATTATAPPLPQQPPPPHPASKTVWRHVALNSLNPFKPSSQPLIFK